LQIILHFGAAISRRGWVTQVCPPILAIYRWSLVNYFYFIFFDIENLGICVHAKLPSPKPKSQQVGGWGGEVEKDFSPGIMALNVEKNGRKCCLIWPTFLEDKVV